MILSFHHCKLSAEPWSHLWRFSHAWSSVNCTLSEVFVH